MNNPAPSQAEPKAPWFQFGEMSFPALRRIAPEHLSVVSNNHLASILFDDFSVDLQTAEDPLCAAVVAVFELPAAVCDNDPFLGFTAGLRGSCSKSPGTRATVMAQLGGSTLSRDFPYDALQEDGLWSETVFSFEESPGHAPTTSTVPRPPFSVNLIVSVQRRSPKDVLVLTIDSLDLAAIRG